MNRRFSSRATPLLLGTLGVAAAAFVSSPAHAMTGPLCSNDCPEGNPTIVTPGYNSAPLTHAEVAPIFWGSYWGNPGSITEGQVAGAVQYIVNGPYTAGLEQYGEFAPPRMSAMTATDTSSGPSSSFTAQDVVNEINKEIGAGVVPPPSARTNMLYAVFMPPGTTSTNYPNDLGFNNPGTCTSACGSSLNGASYTFVAVFPPSGAQGGYSGAFGHELIEALTSNLWVTGCEPNTREQLVDICACLGKEYPNGLILQPYWSAQTGECVIPEAFNTLYQYTGTPGSWTVVGNDVKQVAAGDIGLYATMENDTIYKYSGSGTTWSKLALPGGDTVATLAAGANDVLALDLNASDVYRYPGSGSFTSIGAPFETLTGVTSGGQDIATDLGGNPWLYTGTPGQWSQVGGPGDQFVAGDDWTAAITPSHGDVFLFPLGGGSWIDTGHNANDLYIGALQSLAARDPNNGDVMAMTTSWNGTHYVPNAWKIQCGPMDQVALYGYTNVPIAAMQMLPGDALESQILHNPAPIEGTQGSWTTISPYLNFGTGVEALRLVGHGANLYAAVGLVY